MYNSDRSKHLFIYATLFYLYILINIIDFQYYSTISIDYLFSERSCQSTDNGSTEVSDGFNSGDESTWGGGDDVPSSLDPSGDDSWGLLK